MQKIYCDTNIFLDYYLGRKDPLRPLDLFAFEFFSKGWKGEYILIISDWLMHELENHLSSSQISDILEPFRKQNNLVFIHSNSEDHKKAKQTYKNPDDALHAILANRASADCLVTRNIRDFVDCEDLVKIAVPEAI